MIAKTHQFDSIANYLIDCCLFIVFLTVTLVLMCGRHEAVAGFIGGSIFWFPHLIFAFTCFKSKPNPYTAVSNLMKGQLVMIIMTLILWMIVFTQNYIHFYTLLSYGLCWLVLPLWGLWRYS